MQILNSLLFLSFCTPALADQTFSLESPSASSNPKVSSRDESEPLAETP